MVRNSDLEFYSPSSGQWPTAVFLSFGGCFAYQPPSITC